MWQLLLIALMIQPATPAQPADDAAPAQPTVTAEEPAVDNSGPLRIDLEAMREQRYRFVRQIAARLPESDMQMQFRLAGDDLANLVAVGRLVLDDVVDDTGQQLVDPNEFTTAEREETRAIFVEGDRLVQDGWTLVARLSTPPKRSARVLSTLKGSVKAVFADSEAQEIIIVDPLQFSDQVIEHPRLQELGIQVKVLPPGDPPLVASNERLVALQFLEGQDKIHTVEFFDAWLRNLRARPMFQETSAGEPCVVYNASDGTFDNQTQLVLTVYPSVETKRVPVDMTDVELP